MSEDDSFLRRTCTRYLELLRTTHRPNTIRGHRTCISALVRYLEASHSSVKSFSDLRREHIEAWALYLLGRAPPLVSSTRRRYLITARTFLERIWSLGWEKDPGEALIRREDLPQENKCLPRPLSWEDDQTLQKALRATGGLIAAGLLLLRTTGLRIGELLDLKLDSIREQPEGEWSLQVPLGKLHSERVIPIDKRGAMFIHEILHLRGILQAAKEGGSNDYLVSWPDGRRPNARSFGHAMTRVAKRANITERVWPHRLRHTFATELLRAGIPLPSLMKLLGHSTIKMTLRYAAVSQADVRAAYFESLEKIQSRYKLPETPGAGSQSPSAGSDHQLILKYIEIAAQRMESLRRDVEEQPKKQLIQRLVERLKKLSAEFDKTAN